MLVIFIITYDDDFEHLSTSALLSMCVSVHMCHKGCNVPILGHYNFTECYAYQSSQIGVTESSRDIEGFYWARLASFIIRIHSAQLGFGFVAFRRFS
jgi:hypothetical protein